MSYRVLNTAGFGALEYTHLAVPRTDRGNYPVIVAHSAGSPDDGFGKALPGMALMTAVLARGSAASGRKGIQVMGGSMGGLLPYGNATAQSRLTSMYNQLGKAKVHLVGASMGATASVLWAAANPSKVASINLCIPMASIKNIYEQNQGSATIASAGVGANTIATAWGLTYNVVTASFTSGSTAVTFTVGTMLAGQNGYVCISNTGGTRQAPNNPTPFGATLTYVDATHATLSAAATATVTTPVAIAQQFPTSSELVTVAPTIAAASIPCRLFYSSVDQYVTPSDVTALATALGGSATQIDTTFGHVDGTIREWGAYNGGTNFSELVTYLCARGA